MDYGVILAGGSGTRFWPLSRRARPKHLLQLDAGPCLLRRTLERLRGARCAAERVLVVTTPSQADGVAEELSELPAANVLVEPEARNTLAAVALAAATIERRTPGAVAVYTPADHHVSPPERFAAALDAAARLIADHPEALVTLGVTASAPHEGFGYIRLAEAVGGAPVEGAPPVRRTAGFVEKPPRARAEELIAEGALWNCGVFCWRSDTILAEIARHVEGGAAALAALSEAVAAGEPPPADRLTRAYAELPRLSIDHAVLEHTTSLHAVAADYRWSDVGSWSAVAEIAPLDAAGNAVTGGHRGLDTRGCTIVATEGGLVATVGVEDLVVVHTPQVTLVCPRARAEEVKKLVEELAAEGEVGPFAELL